ncbi:MAG: succinylglutamate desuccinylase/aspartoacylase family protein [Chromatiales bacterium]|nr:succinylglutamate desuccinylase/aspartoacylase family protein [Chromatiales bacterium]
MKSAVALYALLALSSPLAAAEEWGPMELIWQTIQPGEKLKFSFVRDRSFEGSYLGIPVFAARGKTAGPTLCVTAGIHGDEISGVETARRAFFQADPTSMAGSLVVLPTVNASGFRNGDRYLPDRRDLNRYFPGNMTGSVASVIAKAVFEQVIRKCDALVDLHTASFHRTNYPQIRADDSDPKTLELAKNFGGGVIIGGAGPTGSLRRAAVDAGIPTIIYEAGEPMKFQEDAIDQGVRGIVNVMQYLGMIAGTHEQLSESRIFRKSSWVRVPPKQGGFFFPSVAPGDSVRKGDVLGEVIDPFTDERYVISSTLDGEIIGMAVPQVVLSGYGLVHIGIPGKAK